MSLLVVQNLSVSYGPVRAVRDLTIEIAEGQAVALLGANGAGKSTVVSALSGLTPSTSTLMKFGRRSINSLSARQRAGLGMVTVPEGGELFPSLTVAENLAMGAYLRKDRKEVRHDRKTVLTLFPDLEEKLKDRAASLSGGQGQMLAVGRALMAKPRLLLLDEPSHGLAPILVDRIFEVIRGLQRDHGISMLVVEQNANKALAAASYGYVLESGVMKLEGETSRLAQDPLVEQLYLGG